MADNLELSATIKAILDERGFSDYNAAIKKSKDDTISLKGEVDGLGYSFENLKGQLLGMVAAGAVFSMIEKSISTFAEAERAVGNFKSMMAALGPEVAATIPKFDGMLKALGEVYHLTDDQLYPAFNRILIVTGDASEAMAAMTVAARFARAGLGDVEGLARGLAMVLQGSARAARNFGVDVQAVKEAHGDLGKILDLILDKYDKLGKAQKDTKDAIDAQKKSWHEFGEEFGKAFSWIPGMLTNVAYGLHLVTAAVHDILALDWIRQSSSKRAADEIVADMARQGEAAKALSDIETRSILRIALLKQTTATHSEAYLTKINAEIAEDNYKAEKKAESDAEKQAEFAQRMAEKAAQAKTAATKKGTQAWAAAVTEELKLEKTRYDVHAKTTEAMKAVDVWYAAEFEKIVKEMFDYEAAQANINRKEQTTENNKWEEFDLRTKKLNAAAWDKIVKNNHARDMQYAKDTIERDRQVNQEAMGLMSELASKHKSIAIAEATISTYRGVALAFETYKWPWSAVVAALVLAQGLAQVDKISEQDTSGFDDPKNDEMAYMGGRRWASDAVAMLSAGWRDGLREAMPGAAGASIINQNTENHSFAPQYTTNVNISGFVGAGRTDTLKRLKRDLDRVDRQIVKTSRL